MVSDRKGCRGLRQRTRRKALHTTVEPQTQNEAPRSSVQSASEQQRPGWMGGDSLHDRGSRRDSVALMLSDFILK